MTRYSRVGAEQLISDAQPVIAALLASAAELHRLRDANDEHGSEAALVHARLDHSLAWFTQRQIRLDSLTPLTLALPARLMLNDKAVDVWLSWRSGEASIGWFYADTKDVSARSQLPAGALM